jgi:hypothetical protein
MATPRSDSWRSGSRKVGIEGAEVQWKGDGTVGKVVEPARRRLWRIGSEFAAIGPMAVEVAGRASQRPSPLVDEHMVMSAKENQIVDARLPSVDPVFEMVGVAPVGGAVTSGEDTSQVPGAHCGPYGRGDQTFGPAHVEWP